MTTNPPTRSAGARKVWVFVGLVFAFAIVAALAGSVVGSVAYEPVALRHREFTSLITAVSVHVTSGDITIEPSTGADTEVATSGVHGLTYPTDQERVVGHTLFITSSCGLLVPFDNRCSRDYTVRLQPHVGVTVDSEQGSINVTGLDGSLSVHSDQGDVTVIGGSKTLVASSGQGDVTVSRSGATSLSVHSGQGDVSVDLMAPPTRVSASSGQGGVTVELPRGRTSYQVQASSGQGSVTNRVGNNPASARIIDASSGQGDVIVGYGSG
jgi:hypothetical protein